MKSAFLLLLTATASLAAGRDASVHLAGDCYHLITPSFETIKAMGFRVTESDYGVLTTFRHVYNTREWKNLSSRARRVAQTHEGVFSNVTGLRPYEAVLHLGDVNQAGYRDGTKSCKLTLEMDWAGWKRGFFTEGPERFESNGVVEQLLLHAIRQRASEAGLLNLTHQQALDRQAAEDREKPPTQ